MTPEQIKRAVTEACKAFASRDTGRIRAAFTGDAEWLAPKDNATSVAFGFTDHMIGPDTIVRFLAEEFPELFVADVSVDFTHLLCDGDTVVLEMRLQATLTTAGTTTTTTASSSSCAKAASPACANTWTRRKAAASSSATCPRISGPPGPRLRFPLEQLSPGGQFSVASGRHRIDHLFRENCETSF